MINEKATFGFYLDYESNDWYGIANADIEQLPTEELYDMIKEARAELERRGL